MKTHYLILLPLILFLASCSQKKEINQPVGPRVINPVSNEKSGTDTEKGEGQDEDKSFMVPMVELPQDEYLQDIEDINIDTDNEEEQLILTKTTEETGSHLKIYVVDYNSDKHKYQISLEQVIKTQLMDGLSMYLQDLNGNQLNEIIITGFDTTGLHTLDAFSIKTLNGPDGLTYRRVISLAVNGTIDIQTAERSENYASGQKTWESFSIITEETNAKPDDDSLDLVKTVYDWSSASSGYRPVSVAKIPGVVIKEEKLKKLYRGNLNDFKDFLSGPWYRVSDLNAVEQPYLKEILYFNPDEDQVIFTEDNIQEIYNWEDTYRTIFKGIYIQSSNILIKSLRRDIYITVEDMDSIRVKIQGTTEWGGFYKPLNSSLQQNLIKNETLEPVDELSALSGLFKGSRGTEIYLDYPYFTEKSETGESKKGVLSFYNLYGTDILEMRFQKENGYLEKRTVYRVSYDISEDSTRIIRTLTLEPGILSVSGFLAESGESTHLEQIEIKESGKS